VRPLAAFGVGVVCSSALNSEEIYPKGASPRIRPSLDYSLSEELKSGWSCWYLKKLTGLGRNDEYVSALNSRLRLSTYLEEEQLSSQFPLQEASLHYNDPIVRLAH
jgi:hypothetical protein